MAKERIVQTIIETHEEIRIRRTNPRYGCPTCGGNRLMTTPETMARRQGVTVREVFRRIERGELHCVELPDGGVRVCDGAPEEDSASDEDGDFRLFYYKPGGRARCPGLPLPRRVA